MLNLNSKIIEGKALYIEGIRAILLEKEATLAVLLCHTNADPDAIGAAYALSQFLTTIQPNLEVEIVLVRSMSRISKDLYKHIPIEITFSPRIKEADIIFLVDTSTIQQLGRWGLLVESLKKPIVVIDHHAIHPKTRDLAQLMIVSEHTTSTCEMVYALFKEAHITPSKEVVLALFWGIVFDTKHFLLANPSTFMTTAELIKLGVDPQHALSLLKNPMRYSERISRIKAAQRLRLEKLDEWLITFSYVSSYQSSAARAFIGLGASVAVVCGNKKRDFHISIRSSDEFFERTRIHLGKDIAQPLGDYITGMGSGHRTAAGVNGVKRDFNQICEKCISLLQQKLKKD